MRRVIGLGKGYISPVSGILPMLVGRFSAFLRLVVIRDIMATVMSCSVLSQVSLTKVISNDFTVPLCS